MCRFYGKEKPNLHMKQTVFSFLVMVLLGLFFLIAGCSQNPPGVTLPGPVPALRQENYTSNETLVAFVDSAVAYVKTHGKEDALKEFSDPHGSFIRGELYIYAYDFNGTTLAHPVSPEKIGVNRLNESGGVGMFVREMSGVVRNGSGFYRFSYVNPAHNRTLESKLGYGVKVDENWWLGSGVYTGPADPAR
jgi:cytochrome c